jgi:hypothetical protein
MTRAGSTSGPRVANAVLERSMYRSTPAPRLFRPVTSPQPSTGLLNCSTLADHRIPSLRQHHRSEQWNPAPPHTRAHSLRPRRESGPPTLSADRHERSRPGGRVAAQLSEPGASRTWNWLAKTVAHTMYWKHAGS